MNDLISRKEAIDEIYEHEFSNWCDKDEVCEILENLPSIKQDSKWVLVGERLPKQGEKVLTCHNNGGYSFNHILLDNEWFYDDVIAWMELPEFPHLTF